MQPAQRQLVCGRSSALIYDDDDDDDDDGGGSAGARTTRRHLAFAAIFGWRMPLQFYVMMSTT